MQLGNADTNFPTGVLTTKYTGNDTNGVTRKIYMRYDLSSLPGEVLTASLSMTVSTNNGGGLAPTEPQNFTFNLYGLNDGFAGGAGVLGKAWGESDITWNNGPANIVSGAGAGNPVNANATLIGSFSMTTILPRIKICGNGKEEL